MYLRCLITVMSDPLTQLPLGSRFGALTIVRTIGKGASAVVYCSRAQNDSEYAVKAIPVLKSDLKRHKRTLEEIAAHRRVASHQNIIPLLDVFSDQGDPNDDTSPRNTYLVLPFAPSGDLYSLVFGAKKYLNNPALIRSVFLQVLSAVQHCHSRGVFHRDIKIENIFAFDEGRRVVLGDFGLATMQPRSCEWGVGTLHYMSPECLGGPYAPEQGYSSAANDVWSLGVLLINLLTARNPWRKATASDPIFVEYCCDPRDFLVRAFPISQQVNAVLTGVFVAEEERVSIAELMGSIAVTRVWYHGNAIFDGYMARWRTPEDEHQSQVCSKPPALATVNQDSDSDSDSEGLALFQYGPGHSQGLEESSSKLGAEPSECLFSAAPRRLLRNMCSPPHLIIRQLAGRTSSELPPSLSSTSCLSSALPETPLNTKVPEAQHEPKKVSDSFRWISTTWSRTRLSNRLLRAFSTDV